MTTTKQKQAAAIMVENGGNASRAMIDAGYSPATAKTPSKLTQSRGYQAFLESAGLTSEMVVRSLVQDIKGKPENRIRELRLAADILGISKPKPEDERPNKQVMIFLER